MFKNAFFVTGVRMWGLYSWTFSHILVLRRMFYSAVEITQHYSHTGGPSCVEHEISRKSGCTSVLLYEIDHSGSRKLYLRKSLPPSRTVISKVMRAPERLDDF